MQIILDDRDKEILADGDLQRLSIAVPEGSGQTINIKIVDRNKAAWFLGKLFSEACKANSVEREEDTVLRDTFGIEIISIFGDLYDPKSTISDGELANKLLHFCIENDVMPSTEIGNGYSYKDNSLI